MSQGNLMRKTCVPLFPKSGHWMHSLAAWKQESVHLLDETRRAILHESAYDDSITGPSFVYSSFASNYARVRVLGVLLNNRVAF